MRLSHAHASLLRWRVHRLAPNRATEVKLSRDTETIIQLVDRHAYTKLDGSESAELSAEEIVWSCGHGGSLTFVSPAECHLLHVWIPFAGAADTWRQVAWDDAELEWLNEFLSGRSVLGHQLSAWRFSVRSGYETELRHQEEQISCALEGCFRMFVERTESDVTPGDVVYVPEAQKHGGTFCDGDVDLLEVFAPPRISEVSLVL